jgi:hypothetical protein
MLSSICHLLDENILLEQNTMLDQDIDAVRAQIAHDYQTFYSLKCSEIKTLNVLQWWPRELPPLNIDFYASLVSDYFPAIVDSFYELISCYAYSGAAEKVAQEHDKKSQKGYANHWRFLVRNYHFHMFIPRYYSLLDYCAFLINELSHPHMLVKDTKSGEPKRVDYEEMIKSLEGSLKRKEKRGTLEEADLRTCSEALKEFKARLSTQDEQLLKRFRDVITHRYLPGIDEMTVSIERSPCRTRVDSMRGKLMRLEQGFSSYDLYGVPEFKFKELEPLARTLILSADQALKKLYSIGVVQRAFSRLDSK